MLNDPLSNTLSAINNAEQRGKKTCSVKPSSKLIKNVLSLLKDNHYIGEFKELQDNRGGILEIQLLGAVNSCGAIKPRSSVKKEDFEKWEKRHLPAKDFGILIVSTPKGLMSHTEAKRLGLGGALMAYCY